jgi:hypothetical protein
MPIANPIFHRTRDKYSGFCATTAKVLELAENLQNSLSTRELTGNWPMFDPNLSL